MLNSLACGVQRSAFRPLQREPSRLPSPMRLSRQTDRERRHDCPHQYRGRRVLVIGGQPVPIPRMKISRRAGY